MSRNAVWWRGVFGKLVTAAGGPIVHGDEHRHTGKSPELPDELLEKCHPFVTGIGSNDLTNWSEYPWLEGKGGLVVNPVRDRHGVWHVVAGRVRPRPERPAEVRSRFFVQAHYLVAPLQSLPELALVKVPDLLDTEPMLRVDQGMQPIPAVAPEDVPLPKGWVTALRPYLEILLSGQPVAVVDVNQAPKEYFVRFFFCVCCLPRILRPWISFGAGFCELKGQVALGHGSAASTEIYYQNNAWHGLKLLDGEAHKLAGEYLKWLETTPASSVNALLGWLDSEAPGLESPDLLNGVKSWPEALQLTLTHWREARALARLREWLEEGRGAAPPPLTEWKYLRPAVVRVVVAGASKSGGGGRLLARLAQEPTWRDVWATVAKSEPSVAVAGILLGVLSFRIQRLVEGSLAVPAECEELVRSVVHRALLEPCPDRTDLRAWGRVLVRLHNEAPSWYRPLFRSDLRLLFWRACQAWLLSPTEPFLDPFKELKEAVVVILAEEGSLVEGITWLLNSIPESDPTVALPLIEHCWTHQRYAAAMILLQRVQALGGTTRLDAELAPDRWYHLPARKAIVGNVANFILQKNIGPEVAKLLLDRLLRFWSDVPEVARQQLRKTVENQLKPHTTYLFYGGEYPGGAFEPPALVKEVLPTAITTSPEVLQRVIDCAGAAASLNQHLQNWIDTTDEASLRPFPILHFVRDVRLGRQTELPELELSEARMVARLVGDRASLQAVKVPESLGTLARMRACLALAGPRDRLPAPSPLALREGVEAVAGDPKEKKFFEERLTRLGVLKKPDWRLLSGQWPGRLSTEEADVLGKVQPVTLVRGAAGGWPVPRAQLDKIHDYELRQSGLTEQQVFAVSELAVRQKASQLAWTLLGHLFSEWAVGWAAQPYSDSIRRQIDASWRQRLFGWVGGWFKRTPPTSPWVEMVVRLFRTSGMTRQEFGNLPGMRVASAVYREPLPTQSH